jgi:proteasome lid subunit RPN8/RPN11
MNWKEQAAIHADKQAPKESCGLLAIIKGKETYWPCDNLSESPDEFFVIDPDNWADCEDEGELIGIIHSHAYGSALPSEADKASCEHLGLPFYIYSVKHKNWINFEPSGYTSGLYGRTWIWGKHDCWSLITDYFLSKKQINLKFWERPKSIKTFCKDPYFEKVLTGSGFKEVSKDNIINDDVLLMQGPDEKLNHVALYIGDQTILHHNVRHLSCRELYDLRYIEATKKVYRYEA